MIPFRKHTVRFLLTALVASALSGCVSGGADPAQLDVPAEIYTSLARYQRVYLLGPGDQIEMSVENVGDWNRTGIVRPDGMFTVPKIGDVNIGGLSVPEATAKLGTALAGRLRDPRITLTVQNPRDDVVLVAGDVGRVGPVPTRQAPTVAAALIAAGGLLRTAASSKITLIRLDDEGHLVARVLVPTSRGQAGTMLSLAAIPVRGGDLIFIPENGRSQFARFIQDIINTPLTGVNQLFTPYIQYRLAEAI